MKRKNLTAIIILLLLLIGNARLLHADTSYYYYKQLGIREGLSQSKVQCVLNDHRGYLWIGTESGLNCYDRDHLKQYLHQSGKEKTLPHNHIIFLAEDSLYNLWIGTMSGICLYDRANDNFRTLLHHGKPIYVASCLWVEGGILLAGSGTIYKFEYETQQLKVLYEATDPSFYTPFWKMIRTDHEHILLNSRWHGIYSFNLKTGELKKIDSFAEKNYTGICLDSHKRLWVSVYGKGLYCYENNQLREHFTAANSPLTYDVIHDLTERENELWVATDGGGINIISLDDFSFRYIQQEQDNIRSFPSNTIYRLYVDPSDNMWAGSIRNGLIGIKSVYACSFQNVPFGNQYGLSNPTINGFFQDDDGMIWIGTDGGGINRFDPISETFRHYPATRHEKVVSIVDYTPDELLFFSFNKGLFIFHKQTGQIRPFMLVNPEINHKTCISGFSVYLQRISKNKILFSAQHIFIYDAKTRKFEMVAGMGKEYQRNSPLIITTVGTKTYLADLHNICVYDTADNRFETLYQGEQMINDVCMDRHGIFWIASEEGLVRYDPHTGKSGLIQTNLFQETISVLADHHDRVWIGTRRNLYVYSSVTRNFIQLDEIDGVMPNEYLFHAALLAKNGDVYAGGTTGMTVVNSAVHFNVDTVYTLELLDVLLNGLPAPLTQEQKAPVPTVRIPWNFSSLQLKVLLNEDDIFRKNTFIFGIKGFDKELTRNNSNQLTIRHLPIGEYTITASYYTRIGEWSPKQQILHIIVAPPWWKTVWFRAGAILLLLLCAYGIVFYFHRKNQVKQRKEITRIKNRMYEEKINFLTNISHELRTPLTLICAPLKRLIDRESCHKDTEHQLGLIYRQACQMKIILDMVLDVRKLEEGQDQLHIVPHPLNEWVRSVGDKFANEYKVKGIKLAYDPDERIHTVPFDKIKCEFVLSNFLMNALKFSESSTTTTLITRMSPNNDRVRISVKDEGIGLDWADTAGIFSNFYQGTHEKGGSGIGLSYAKTLITLHKGNIGALNAPERGAEFYYELPLSTDANAQAEWPSEEAAADIGVKEPDQIDYTFLKKFFVIVVEDTAELRNYLKETLSDYFARVYVAKDGKEGLEQIKKKVPDIIISDVMMPRMNGFDLCREVKTNLDISHIPFILLTAYHDSHHMRIGYKTGADAFLPKPFEVDSLLALIYNQLRQREQIRLRYQEDQCLSHKEMCFSNADEAFLLKLNAFIANHMSNPKLDVTFLAHQMCMSRSLLFNKVKAITGMGIINYVNKQRIDKSIMLLTTTSMNITEISEVVGFSSSRYFSRVFKAIKGENPSAYRKM